MKKALLFCACFVFSLRLLCAENVFTFEKQEQYTTVEALNANYDGDNVYLSGGVTIQNPIGEAKAENAVLTKEEVKEHKIDFPFVELKENVSVKLADGGMLECDSVSVDLILMSSLFVGKQNEKQVIYADERGQIQADKAIVDFAKGEEGRYLPKKITLVGHIRLMESGENGNRYALADYVEVYPQIGKMVFEGREGNKVLFFDEKRKVQLSARSIEATKEESSGKESIQGFGDVRFVFAKEEFEKLQSSLKLLDFDNEKEVEKQ